MISTKLNPEGVTKTLDSGVILKSAYIDVVDAKATDLPVLKEIGVTKKTTNGTIGTLYYEPGVNSGSVKRNRTALEDTGVVIRRKDKPLLSQIYWTEYIPPDTIQDIVNTRLLLPEGIPGTFCTFDLDDMSASVDGMCGTQESEDIKYGVGRDSRGFYIVSGRANPGNSPYEGNLPLSSYSRNIHFYRHSNTEWWAEDMGLTRGNTGEYRHLIHEYTLTDSILLDTSKIPDNYEGIFCVIPGFEMYLNKIPGILY